MNLSYVRQIGAVPFPMWTGERVYMRPFTKAAGLPPHLSRWQPTVDAMLKGVETYLPIYLMIDQGEIMAGSTHRRAGVHIDGYWHAEVLAHGQAPYQPPGHGDGPSRPPHHAGSWKDQDRRWKTCDLTHPEGLILASDVAGCRAFVGRWVGEVGEGGDCSAVDLSGLRALPMKASVAYAGNVGMLHESLPLARDAQRTVVRLNIPGWSPERQQSNGKESRTLHGSR